MLGIESGAPAGIWTRDFAVDSIRIRLWRVTAAHTRPGYTTGAFSLGANGFNIKGGYKFLAYQVIDYHVFITWNLILYAVKNSFSDDLAALN